MKVRLLCFVVLGVWGVMELSAQSLQQAIDLTLKGSTRLTIASKQTQIDKILKREAKTGLLPNIAATYTDGTRRTKIANLKDKLSEKTRSITLTQPLFNGLSTLAKIKEAKFNHEASKQNLDQIRYEIAFTVTEQYLYSTYLKKMLDLEDKHLNLLEEALQLARQSLELQDTDYTQFTTVALKTNKAQLKRQTDQLALDNHRLELELLMGQPLTHPQMPQIETLEPISELEPLLQNNPSVKAGGFQIKSKSAAVVARMGAFAPKASLYLKYDYQQASQYFNGESVTNTSAYLNIEVPIFQKGTEYTALSKAKKEKQMAQLSMDYNLEELHKELKLKVTQFIALSEHLKSMQQMLVMAEAALALSKERLIKQDIAKLEVLLQEADLIEMQLQRLDTQLNRDLAYFKVKQLTAQRL